MTEQRFIEIWKESAEYDQIQTLFNQVMDIDDDTVTHVSLNLGTVNPDHTENLQRVCWNRRTESVEVED